MKHRYILAGALLIATAFADQRQAFGSRRSALSKQPQVQRQSRAVINKYAKTSASLPAGTGGLAISSVIDSPTVKSGISVIVGTVLTYVLNNIYSLGPVQASSITSLFVSLVLPEKLAIAAACGSFAGMARSTVISGIKASAILGVVCAAVMYLFDKLHWFVGVGGRLGFIAQCACTMQFIFTSLIQGASESATLIGKYPTLNEREAVLICLSTVVGAIVMRLWKQMFASLSTKSQSCQNVNKKLSSTVAAVGATGLIATLVTPPSVAGPAFCGSFVAMSSPVKLGSQKALVFASLLAGVSQLLLRGVLLGGWGGKLGTASLMGVLFAVTLAGIKDAISSATSSKSTNTQPSYRRMQSLSS